jgi:TolA-binding protein
VGFSGCSQMTLLRTHELRQVETQVEESRKELAALQKSVDDLNLQQGGSTNKMRADLTSLLTDLQAQISRLHSEIDETQHRLAQLNQKLDRLDQRKFVVMSSDSGQAGGNPPAVKVVPGLDLEHLFGQAREDYIRGRYDLAYQGFKAIYEKDDAGTWRGQSLYWMAECLWKGDKPDRALELYQRVTTEFPEGAQRCPAWLKMGLIFEQKQDFARRNEALNELLSACPQSNEAARAREMMK